MGFLRRKPRQPEPIFGRTEAAVPGLLEPPTLPDAFSAWASEPLAPLEPLSPPYEAPPSWAAKWLPPAMLAELDAEAAAAEPRVSRPTHHA